MEWDIDGDVADEEEDKIALGVVGSLWSSRVPNPNAFIATMKNIWTVKHGVEIVNIRRNLYQVQFFHWRDYHGTSTSTHFFLKIWIKLSNLRT